jgi:hypothetical protein
VESITDLSPMWRSVTYPLAAPKIEPGARREIDWQLAPARSVVPDESQRLIALIWRATTTDTHRRLGLATRSGPSNLRAEAGRTG